MPRRDIINISLPPSLTAVVKTSVKKGHYSSTSEFFRYLLREWIEEKMVHDLHESRKEIDSGKGKTLRSLKQLR